jgi:ATP-binding cassette subfamily B (MDR/TAP) protein 1
MDVRAMFTVLFTVVFAAIGIGNAMSFAPDVGKAKAASASLFKVIDHASQIDYKRDSEHGVVVEPFHGNAAAEHVGFAYPARPEVQVLKDFSALVEPGKTLALVGSSGSGKSTLVSLIQRFYDVHGGKVTAEHTNVKEWKLQQLRANMALVGQEPVLFDRTVADNIAYGAPEGMDVSQDMIEQAAKAANIHDFVVNLPEGYQTRVGERGSLLSGGQKQRVAIARALIRNPRLLLLDEATSALDSESEKVVQYALDKAAQGRTTITIAHRLSTIQDADTILVVKGGQVVEQGKHLDLVAQKGLYYNLVQKQSLATTQKKK